jgi:hypothetical protein
MPANRAAKVEAVSGGTSIRRPHRVVVERAVGHSSFGHHNSRRSSQSTKRSMTRG